MERLYKKYLTYKEGFIEKQKSGFKKICEQKQFSFLWLMAKYKIAAQMLQLVQLDRQFITLMSKSAKGQTQEISADDLDYYQVEEIIKKKEAASGTEYLIKWKGYPDPKDFTWQPLQHLKQVMHLIDEFNQRKEEELPKTKMKQENQQRKAKKIKKLELEDQVVRETVSQNQAEEINSESFEQRANKKKAIQKKGGFLPKVIKINVEEQKQPVRKKLYSSLPHNSKQQVKNQISRYLIPINQKSAEVIQKTIYKGQPIQGEKHFWFNQEPYKLDSVFKHCLKQGKIKYLCNVMNKNGGLACLAEVAENQLEIISKEMEKGYILNVLRNLWKLKEEQTTSGHSSFEKAWKDA